MKTIRKTTAFAWLIGIIEFRQSITTHFENYQIEAYDKGRELMHKLTLRAFEEA